MLQAGYICTMSAQSQKPSLFPVDFLAGMSEGLVLPLAACIIALSFFDGSPLPAMVTGIAVALPGALVFGWARYSGELEEIQHKHPEHGLEEAEKELALLQHIGIDATLTEAMKAEMEQERALWLKEIQEHKLGWEQQDKKRAFRGAMHTAAGFFTGGILVAIPFISVTPERTSLLIPLVWAFVCLGILGWIKGRVTGRSPVGTAAMSSLRGVAITLVAGLVAWAVHHMK